MPTLLSSALPMSASDDRCHARIPGTTRWMLAPMAVCIALAACIVATPLATAQQAWGPPYKTIPLPDKFKGKGRAISQAKLVKEGVLQGRLVLDEKREEFVSWYRDYQFRRLTLPEFFHEIDKIRDDLMKDLRGARSPDVHQFLIDTYFTYASKICTENYYPAARVNSMLLIAGLNQLEENARTQPQPTPYARALTFMLQQLQDGRQLDGVKAVALVGIRRHVRLALANPRYTFSPAQRDAILTVTRSLIAQREPPAGRTASGHAWMQRRAMESAVLVADLNKDTAILQDLAAILNEDEADPSLVCATARAVGHLRVPRGIKYDAVPLAQRIGKHVVMVVDREADRIAKKKEAGADSQIPEGYGGMMDDMAGGGGPDGPDGGEDSGGYYGSGDDADDGDADKKSTKEAPKSPEDVTRMRRILKYQFTCLLAGLTGPDRAKNFGLVALSASDNAKQAEIAKIATAIQAILAATDPEDPDTTFANEDEVLKSVQQKLADLEAVLPQPEPDEPAADAAAEPGAAPADKPADAPAGAAADEPGGVPAGGKAGDADKGKKG